MKLSKHLTLSSVLAVYLISPLSLANVHQVNLVSAEPVELSQINAEQNAQMREALQKELKLSNQLTISLETDTLLAQGNSDEMIDSHSQTAVAE
ncbi:hypothetical protein [Thalassotalea agarivorans]|uniref:Uncharacterized protein n=1 Tax=Thalassotalea agarivorans TaxID=349064 RepID=A0A1I0FGQ9_THASX|nr:hypothetical protein [Thalassotalea agarivorans]SET56576.1 hypothetical protein SAMN05660429_02099 [Thalassotalea agarivorans]